MAYLTTVNGFDIYRDNYGCFYYGDGDEVIYIPCPTVGAGQIPATPVPTYPVGGGGGIIQPGGSWYNDLLNTILGLSAIGAGGRITAQGINTQNQYPTQYPVGQYPAGQYPQGVVPQNLAATAGSTLGNFVQKNAFLLLAGVGVYVLYASGRKR